MCAQLEVDTTKTVRFDKKLYNVLQYTHYVFGSMATSLVSHTEEERDRRVQPIFTELRQLKQVLQEEHEEEYEP